MLTKLSTLRTTTKVLSTQNSPTAYSLQQVHYTQRNIYHFKKDLGTMAIQKHINSEQTNLKSANNLKYKFQQFIVPRRQPNVEDLNTKLDIDWKHRKLVLNIDPSALIGSKRLYMKNHLQKNIYQGLSSPRSIFSQDNPTIEITTQQIRFDPEHFLYSDPIAKQMLNNTTDLPQQQQYDAIEQTLSDVYEKQPQRFGNRLKNQLKVPEPYHKIIELGMYNDNQIFFCGLNEYSLRHLLARCYTLQQLKQIFMLSLRYAQSQSLRSITTEGLALKGKLEQHYNDFARELIYLNNYKIIKEIQNGQILRRISFVTAYRPDEEQLDQQQQREIKEAEAATPTRGRRSTANKINAKNKEGLVLLAHSYTIETLNDYTMIKNLQQQLNKKQPNILNRALNFPPLQQKQQAGQSPNPSQNDAEKIQKHAILEVMLGDLWNQPYTFNKFPYISQDYNKLNEDDQNHVKQIYYQHVTKYTGAKKVYYEKNINKLNRMSAAQLAAINIKDAYKQTRENYEKNLETINKKQKEKQEVKEKKEKMARKKNKDEEMFKQYPGKYEEQPSEQANPPSQPQNQISDEAAQNAEAALKKQQRKKEQQPIGRKRKQKSQKPASQLITNKQS